jgi:hypothetical protein
MEWSASGCSVIQTALTLRFGNASGGLRVKSETLDGVGRREATSPEVSRLGGGSQPSTVTHRSLLHGLQYLVLRM